MKFSHKIFHLEKDNEREHLYRDMSEYISQYSSELITPTIEISSQKDLNDLYNKTNIRFTDEGYEFDNETGWRFGELGIWASNIYAYKNFLETDSDYLILMEDDIEYLDGFFENLIKYMSQLPEDWDLFFYYAPDNKNDWTIQSDNLDICKAYQDWSCLCYVINRNTASKILKDLSNPISLPIDYYFFKQPEKYNSYTVKTSSRLYCRIADMESTFQTKQQRKAIN
jgi:GR25 family glycosyltransferase involved in LPS biosynthesis